MVKSVVRHKFDGFFDFYKLPEIRTVKGFSAVFFSGTEWEIYVPKCGALSTALHTDFIIFFIRLISFAFCVTSAALLFGLMLSQRKSL